MKHTIEGHKLFPYIAWATVISFAFFTYMLATNLQDDLNQLSKATATVESGLQ